MSRTTHFKGQQGPGARMETLPGMGILHLSVYTLKSGSLSGSLSLSRANCFYPDSDPDPDPDLESVNHFPGFMKDAPECIQKFAENRLKTVKMTYTLDNGRIYERTVVKVVEG